VQLQEDLEFNMIRSMFVATLLTLSFASAGNSLAQTAYPDRPIKMVVPYAPGGQFDIHARALANKMKDSLKQNVLIENRPGAATALGTSYVAQSKNDGYTILFAGANAFAVAPHQIKDLGYKVSDFQPISLVSLLPQGLIINTKVIPVSNFAEFIAYVKARPNKFSYGTSGTGGSQHLIGENMKKIFNLDIVQIGYRGTPEVLQELLTGQIGFTIDGVVAYMPKMGSDGPLKTIAVNSSVRLPAVPDAPSFEELGYPEMTSGSWGAIFAPAGTPRPAVDALRNAIMVANNDPEIRDFVIKGGATPITSTPEELQALIETDSKKWAVLVKLLDVK
jgi:tripartite-type tricarboxylate transporter receptor subunit TctC